MEARRWTPEDDVERAVFEKLISLTGDEDRSRKLCSFNRYGVLLMDDLLTVPVAPGETERWAEAALAWFDQLEVPSFGPCFIELFAAFLVALPRSARTIENANMDVSAHWLNRRPHWTVLLAGCVGAVSLSE